MYLLYDAYQYNDGEKKKKRRFVMKAVVLNRRFNTPHNRKLY